MKNAITGFTLAFAVLIIAAVGGINLKDSTTKSSFEQAIEMATMQAVKESYYDGTDLKEDFESSLSTNLNSKMDGISITYKEADATNGILSVHVEKTYKNFGNDRLLKYDCCVIQDDMK